MSTIKLKSIFKKRDTHRDVDTNNKHIYSDNPMVSCIMPTYNRPDFLAQAVLYFNRQDYPNKELIIVFNSIDDLPSGFQAYDNIKLVQSSSSYSIGAKRNIACKLSDGDIIVQWDDDDWYASDRISRQVKPIIDGVCDITALNNTLFFVPGKKTFWYSTPELFKSMCTHGVLGGTLAYRKDLLSEQCRYPDISLREDAELLENMIKGGARLLKIDGHELFIYVRHNMNSWQFSSGKFLKPNEWSRAEMPNYIIPDMEFYNAIYKDIVDKEIETSSEQQIKVSCIMPTANRRQFVSKAIDSFINQSYANRELIVVDDGEDSVADIIPVNDNRIKYLRLTDKLTIGKKRNLACDKSVGDIIIHWDDDDWYSSDWIEYQVKSLLTTNADVTGLSNPYFHQPDTDKSWQYIYPDQDMPWVHGATLCYTRQLWKRNPFPEMNIGEDVRFLWSTCPKKIVPHTRTDHYIGIIHKGNTSPKHVTDRRWNSIDTAVIINNTGVDISKL